MLIQKFFVPNDEMADVGLKEVNMSRLGRLVGLAGKNGSGKSRLLNKLEYYINARVEGIRGRFSIEEQIRSQSLALKNNPHSPHAEAWSKNVKEYKYKLELADNRVISSLPGEEFKVVRFVPKKLTLKDPNKSAYGELVSRFNNAKKPGVSELSDNCLFYIHQLQNRWWNSEHPGFSGATEEKVKAIEEYKKFNDLISTLLGVSLNRDIDGNPTLFGKRIPESGLSDGQNILLQLCTALHAQHIELNNTVFILDEPENHLHPSSVIDLLNNLYNAAPKSQIWIATHSVPLLAFVAHIEPMSLWFVNDGFVKNAGRHPEVVLGSLLGDASRIAQLNSFTGLPSQLAAINYACESLLPPKTIPASDKDSQATQTQKIINRLIDNRPLSLLDFGAGKGRLLDGMASDFRDIYGTTFSEKVEYYAFDPFLDDKDDCVKLIQSHYPDEKLRYFNVQEDFFNNYDDGSIDIVVMCNVFHEISPRQWISLFSRNSLIMRSLNEKGYLLIIEDQRIPVGEMAHDYGFLVLDTDHLKTLFSVTIEDINNELFGFEDERGDGRLKAHLISKTLLSRITAETIKSSIDRLNDTAKSQIKRIRALESSYENGQLNGFWTQQFSNSSLFLEEG